MQSLEVEETVAAVERLAIVDTTTEETKLIGLKCSDGVTLEVREAVAMEWLTFREMGDDVSGDGAADVIPLPNVSSEVLLQIIEYTEKHLRDTVSDHDHHNLCAWDGDFVDVDTTTLYHLMMAANYLNIPSLLDLTAKRAADIISKCKTVEKIRETFNIVNDYTREEEEEIRSKYPWAFEEETNSR